MRVTSLENLVIDKVHLTESTDECLHVTVAAIHEGLTRNLTYYTGDCLKGSIELWVKPYNRKVLTHHDYYGEPVGFVVGAYYAFDEKVGRNATYLKLKITDRDAIEKVKDGRYNTVSIGCSVDDGGIKCSICGEEPYSCEHYRGEIYEGKLCYWIVESMTPDEVSFVNIPADSNAIVVEVEDGNKDQQDGQIPASNGNIVLAANASFDKKLNENAEKNEEKNAENVQTEQNYGIISNEQANNEPKTSKAKEEFAALYYSLLGK